MTIERRDVRHPDGRQFSLYGDIADSTIDALLAQSPDTGYDPSHLHRRFDRLTGSWVLVSPTRNVRPSATTTGDGAPVCPLCPGGPELPGPFDLAVFENRFPSLSPAAPPTSGELVAPSRGRCLVVVYTSEHVEDLGELTRQQFANVVAVWRDRTTELWDEGHEYVMAFENHGSDVGATLAHLHGQIYALDHVPPVIVTKLASHVRHRRELGECLGCRLVAEDLGSGRVIHDNVHFVAALPFAPRWPLEVHVRAKGHGVGRLGDLDADGALDLVRALSDVIARYDGLWGFELPYLMCVQEAPPGHHDGSGEWHLHVELLPPHRNATRLKVRASVETALGVYINDTEPESVAASLRAVAAPLFAWTGVVVPAIVAAPDGARLSVPVTTVRARAPGRVNLIGDHTDYTGGLCFPMAIDRSITVSGNRRADRPAVCLVSTAEPAPADVALDVDDPRSVRPEWARYVAGVVAAVRPSIGFDGNVDSTIPAGSGLSSSAALEVAVALALGAAAATTQERLALARLCQAAEHAARGVPTGLLDQLACINGVEGHGLLIDCLVSSVTPVALPPDDAAEWVVVNAGARSLASSGYSRRVAELAAAAAEIGPIRDASPADVESLGDPTLRARARHVVAENARVTAFAAAIAAGDLAAAGALMNDSHRSLSTDFESSVPAVDELCRSLAGRDGVFGVRITGAGWGGCVVALTTPGAVSPDEFAAAWRVRPSAGASVASEE